MVLENHIVWFYDAKAQHEQENWKKETWHFLYTHVTEEKRVHADVSKKLIAKETRLLWCRV